MLTSHSFWLTASPTVVGEPVDSSPSHPADGAPAWCTNLLAVSALACCWFLQMPLCRTIASLGVHDGGEGWIHAKADSHLQPIAPKQRLLAQQRWCCWAKKHFKKNLYISQIMNFREAACVRWNESSAVMFHMLTRREIGTAFQYYYFKFRYERSRRKRWAGENGAVFCRIRRHSQWQMVKTSRNLNGDSSWTLQDKNNYLTLESAFKMFHISVSNIALGAGSLQGNTGGKAILIDIRR